MRIDTQLTGVNDVYRVLNNVGPREARNIMRATVGGMAAEVRKESRKEAPKEDGDLGRAISVKRRRIRDNVVRADVVVRPLAFYWRFIEYGTSKLGENPFFLRTIRAFEQRAMKSFLDNFARTFTRALARAARRNGG